MEFQEIPGVSETSSKEFKGVLGSTWMTRFRRFSGGFMGVPGTFQEGPGSFKFHTEFSGRFQGITGYSSLIGASEDPRRFQGVSGAIQGVVVGFRGTLLWSLRAT